MYFMCVDNYSHSWWFESRLKLYRHFLVINNCSLFVEGPSNRSKVRNSLHTRQKSGEFLYVDQNQKLGNF